MIKTSSDLLLKSLVIFGKIRKCSPTFVWPSEILENRQKSSHWYGSQCNKQNNKYMVACRCGISLLVFNFISQSFVVFTREISC